MIVFLLFVVVETLLDSGFDPRAVGRTMDYFTYLGTGRKVWIGVLTLVGGGLSLVVTVGACRLFVREIDTLDTVDLGVFTDRILRAVGSLLVVQIALGVALAVALLGLQLLAVIGLPMVVLGLVALAGLWIYAAVTVPFVPFAIAVENRGPFAALGRSAEIARDHRRSLLGIVLVWIVTVTPFSVLDGIRWTTNHDSGAVMESVVGFAVPAFRLASTFWWAVVSTVLIAVLAEIYTTVTGETDGFESDDTSRE
ncbi:hypothetical protein HARCEL1_01555 [Halococcoides cellulosivorans]|uniref:DUF7847 domain-containing protein n=2 Tax=Halococcoides cellulosivorans TaxID=1679096 RepID=A0A2R4WY85_9EURY|nr:hypothetical protein HARCEL1_01555 [Halococcoides cellulosivorans]